MKKPYKCLKCNHSFLQKKSWAHISLQCIKWRNPTNVWNLTLVFSKKKSWAHTLLQCMKWKTLQMFEMWLVFSKKKVLSTHITSVHEMKKPYKCLKCEFSFLQKEELNTHIHSTVVFRFKHVRFKEAFDLKGRFHTSQNERVC